MPSFDIVSRAELEEVDNAVGGVRRDIEQRYDFKGSKCSIERNDSELTILADDDLKLKQMHELLQANLARRKLDAKVIEYLTPEKAAGMSVRQKAIVKQGVGTDLAKKIVKELKSSKIKVQVSIQGDEVRVAGKKRDDLQNAIAHVKEMDVEQPLQYVNFRD